MLHQIVEGVGGDRGGPEHERHLPVDFADDGDIAPAAPLRLQQFEQIQRHIRIGTQAVLAASLDAAFGDELGDHVDALGRDVARDMGVIAADIVPLRISRP
jgi:hypothetical protein